MARAHRHTGLGFTGYILVLTDRPSTPPTTPPTPTAAWLTARFPEQYIVVVEGGAAVVWKGRALRGVVPVDDERTSGGSLPCQHDGGPWPGRHRRPGVHRVVGLGTPIVVPANTVGAVHARAGGGLTYVDVSDLLAGVERLLRESERVPFFAMDSLRRLCIRGSADLRCRRCRGTSAGAVVNAARPEGVPPLLIPRSEGERGRIRGDTVRQRGPLGHFTRAVSFMVGPLAPMCTQVLGPEFAW